MNNGMNIILENNSIRLKISSNLRNYQKNVYADLYKNINNNKFFDYSCKNALLTHNVMSVIRNKIK